MATLHSDPGWRQPVTLLESFSPYGSRKVTVEFDGLVTAAYLYDNATAISATWIANHLPAPQTTDQARLDAGRAPLMPAARTRHPAGRPPLQAAALEALWFEEGDGVAILERGRPVAVIAGWSDMDRGMPGYSLDVIGQTPFGWSLEDAMDGLAPRLERSRAYWRWRQSDSGPEQFQQALLGHLQARLGPGGQYWDASAGKQPVIGVTERPPTSRRPYTVLSTVGMSCQRMPVVEQVLDDPSGYSRVELLLLDSPGTLAGPQPPDLSGFSFGGDPVRWLWIVPISEPERQIAKEHGSAALVSRLAAQQRCWVIG